MTNQVNNRRHKYHPLTAHYHNDSEDDDRSGCRNVSHCHQQFFSELHSPGRSHYTNNLMLLGRKNKNEDSQSINVKIDEQVIKSSPDLKLLGVTLDDELSFSTHISDICKKASKKVGVLVRLRNMIPREAKLQLYKSAILPNLTYCHIVWHFCKACDARKLERVQERALRAVYNDRNATHEELLGKGRLSSLENRRLQDKHNNLRSDFPVPRYNTVKYGKHSIRYLGPHIWGKISQELRSKTSLQAFRRGVCALNVLGLLDGTCGCGWVCIVVSAVWLPGVLGVCSPILYLIRLI